MKNNPKTSHQYKLSSPESESKQTKHFQLIEKTYQSNVDSDYTEKIADVGKNFDYSSNGDRYWGNSELSTPYGTPLYEQASESQKLALNHLYWIGQYNHTANSEANTILYNQITDREMKIMAAGGSIARALKNNIKSWKRFSRSISA